MSLLSSIMAAVRPQAEPEAPAAPAETRRASTETTPAGPLAAVVRAELYSPPHLPAAARKLRRFEEFGLVNFERSAVDSLLKKFGGVPEPTRSKLVGLDEKWKALHAFSLNHVHAAAREYFKTQSRTLAENLATGKVDEATKNTIFTKEEIELEFARKLSAAKVEKRHLSAQAAELIAPLVAQIEKFAATLADELEARERVSAAEFGVTFAPSKTLGTVGQLSWRFGTEYASAPASPAGWIPVFETSSK